MVSGVGRNEDRPLEMDSAFGRDAEPGRTRLNPSDIVLIASDAPLVAQALVELLAAKCSELRFDLESGFEQAATGAPRPILIIVQIAEFRPDHPWLARFTLAMERKYPHVPLLLISEIPVSKLSWCPLERGFAGYLPTSQSSDQLVSAIRVLTKGGGLILRSEESNQRT